MKLVARRAKINLVTAISLCLSNGFEPMNSISTTLSHRDGLRVKLPLCIAAMPARYGRNSEALQPSGICLRVKLFCATVESPKANVNLLPIAHPKTDMLLSTANQMLDSGTHSPKIWRRPAPDAGRRCRRTSNTEPVAAQE